MTEKLEHHFYIITRHSPSGLPYYEIMRRDTFEKVGEATLLKEATRIMIELEEALLDS